jgi:hypothetical protein
MEHLSIEMKGKFTKYAEITAEQGYCFYDVDEEERKYFEKIFTPIIDETEIARKYVVVLGYAHVLNEELARQREEQRKEDENKTEDSQE